MKIEQQQSFIEQIRLAMDASGYDAQTIAKVGSGSYTRIPAAEQQTLIQTILHAVHKNEFAPGLEAQLYALSEVMADHHQRSKYEMFIKLFRHPSLAALEVAEIGHSYNGNAVLSANVHRLFPLCNLFKSYELIGQSEIRGAPGAHDYISLDHPLSKKYDYILGSNVLIADAVTLDETYQQHHTDHDVDGAIQAGDLALALSHALKPGGAIIHHGCALEGLALSLMDPEFQAFGHVKTEAKCMDHDTAIVATITPVDQAPVTGKEYAEWLGQNAHLNKWKQLYEARPNQVIKQVDLYTPARASETAPVR